MRAPRPPWIAFHRAALLAFFAGATTASCTCSSGSSPPAATPPVLTLAPTKASYALSEQVVLEVTVANVGATPCEVLNQPEGAITIVDLRRDGTPVLPTLTSREFFGGFRALESQHFVTVQPNQSTHFAWSARDGTPARPTSLETFTEANDPFADGERFPVATPGHYTLTVRYATPRTGVAPADACVVTATATAEFTVESSSP